MSFEISTVRSFSAAHALRFQDGSAEHSHTHNWRIKVTVRASALNALGLVMDFHDLERRLDPILAAWHNRNLNETPPFDRLNPSAENVAWVIGQDLSLPPGISLVSTEVWETKANSAVYRPVDTSLNV
jgi:6-pyruvoyltetrahydropterin/6-carboxytetrahydropterin synthase